MFLIKFVFIFFSWVRREVLEGLSFIFFVKYFINVKCVLFIEWEDYLCYGMLDVCRFLFC